MARLPLKLPILPLLIMSVGAIACDAPRDEPAAPRDEPAASAPGSDSKGEPGARTRAPAKSSALWQLFEEDWRYQLEQFPRFATYAGVHDHDDRLADHRPEAWRARAAHASEMLARLAAIETETLSDSDRINAAMFARKLEAERSKVQLRDYEMPLNSDEGFHTDFARLPDEHPFRDAADYEHYLARLAAWPRVVDEHLANMRAGLERGFTPPQVVLAKVTPSIAGHLVHDPQQSEFFAPFTRMPSSIPADQQARLREQGRARVEQAVVPGFARFHGFFVNEYIPKARSSLGASELPDGEAYYAEKIRDYTTLALGPDEIHQIGLDEVARIRGEMQTIMEELEFDGSFAEFLTFLREDPQFYAKTPGELMREAAFIAKTMDGKLPSLFGVLPRLPYAVNPVPESLAPNYTAGRYVPAPAGSTQPGQYWVNTYDLPSRPLYNLPALTLHEAVPGHHLQGALAREQAEQPMFRRFTYISAYGEGWGLYSEFLGVEAGIYRTPYEHFGRLTYEMWRACRLVVDTGIHAKGWSREAVLAYLAEHTALSTHEIETETDRYISWPGQALSYKLGELEIKRLRAKAEAELGASFDLRAFHDALLANGSVPLPILAQTIEAWIAARA